MRRVLILFLLAGPVLAQSVEETADAVVKALAAEDQAALAALGERKDPDPWRVADELLRFRIRMLTGGRFGS